MNTTNIIITAILVLILGGLIWTSRINSQNNEKDINQVSASILTTEEKAFDFGTISMAAGKINHTFKIKNSGIDPILIGQIYTSCMCTTALLKKGGKEFGPFGMAGHGFIPKVNEKINAGEEAVIEVTENTNLVFVKEKAKFIFCYKIYESNVVKIKPNE